MARSAVEPRTEANGSRGATVGANDEDLHSALSGGLDLCPNEVQWRPVAPRVAAARAGQRHRSCAREYRALSIHKGLLALYYAKSLASGMATDGDRRD